jgi:hypothetical protein
MLRRLALALLAAVSLGAMALAPTAASAGPWGGWGGYGHHWGHGFGIGFIGAGYDGCYVTRSVLTPFGYRLRVVNICGY